MQKSTQDPSALFDYEVTIRDCNSIEEASISLRKRSLNIKYGPNGIGKSTIARALTLRSDDTGRFEDLTPFKYRANPDSPRPAVLGADDIETVLTFNDAYVSQFVFQRDEVLTNSFEIFINTDEYKKGLEEIESMFDSLKESFNSQTEFNEAVGSFIELRDAFNVTKGGAVAKTSRGLKAIGVGGKLKNIPTALRGYEHFLHSDDPAGWITWQAKGKAYLELSDNCPFCSVPSVDKETAALVSAEYDSAAVRNMSALRAVLDRLGRYFAPDYLKQLEELTTSLEEPSAEQGLFLVTLRSQVETLLAKLSALRNLSFHALREEANVASVLSELRIDLKLLHALNSEDTNSVVALTNQKLDDVVVQIAEINKRIGQQNTRVKRLINDNQKGINEFLQSAGYRYSVRIEASGDSYRMLLEHQDAPGHLESAANHLSYGEKNAFALVLFMHHVQWAQPDLVVLDDPVSSFDKTKKFAILHQLFHGKNSLSGMTSLLLTHDIEPAIDIVRTGTSGRFKAAQPIVHFLVGKAGRVSEKPIGPSDITTFSEVCDANIKADIDSIIKCIYLRRRFEVHGVRGASYDLLSSLLHHRTIPTKKTHSGEEIELSQEEIAAALAEIQQYLPDFDYDALLGELLDSDLLKGKFFATDVGYEKVQIFRLMLALDTTTLRGDAVFTKFVNETYHIENEYVMQLNPRDFDAIPEYVVAACTALVQTA